MKTMVCLAYSINADFTQFLSGMIEAVTEKEEGIQ